MAWKWPGAAAKGASSEVWTGFIDQGVTLEGTLTVTGTFRIDGNVKGNIISEQTVILGESAKVEGQIEGNRVVISGRFDGVIFARSWRHLRRSLPYAGIFGRSRKRNNSDSGREHGLGPILTFIGVYTS